jgi:hypothetical protein
LLQLLWPFPFLFPLLGMARMAGDRDPFLLWMAGGRDPILVWGLLELLLEFQVGLPST